MKLFVIFNENRKQYMEKLDNSLFTMKPYDSIRTSIESLNKQLDKLPDTTDAIRIRLEIMRLISTLSSKLNLETL